MKKKILIIGGTAFVGRVLLEHLLQLGGYEITLFNRGKTNAGLFSGVSQIHGNRETDDIKLLANKNWDVVIDFCGYYPLSLQKIVDTLRGRIGRYIFVSTGSVYDLEQIGEQTITEDSYFAPRCYLWSIRPLRPPLLLAIPHTTTRQNIGANGQRKSKFAHLCERFC